ncbi:MAG: hypothetical protein K9K82_01445 [Desulfobacteraceae bacterium]|nr:hypothetical protein [Desulfobacteraceae bacterium]
MSMERTFLMMFSQRVFCGQLTADDIGRTVQLAGQVMQAAGGKANPKIVQELLAKKLETN